MGNYVKLFSVTNRTDRFVPRPGRRKQSRPARNSPSMKRFVKVVLGLHAAALITLFRSGPGSFARACLRAYEVARYPPPQSLDIPEAAIGDILGDRRPRISMPVTRYEEGMLPSEEAMVLLAIAVAEQPEEVLEIGTFMGYTTRALAENLPGATIHTVDLPESFSPDVDTTTDIPKDDFHLIQRTARRPGIPRPALRGPHPAALRRHGHLGLPPGGLDDLLLHRRLAHLRVLQERLGEVLRTGQRTGHLPLARLRPVAPRASSNSSWNGEAWGGTSGGSRGPPSPTGSGAEAQRLPRGEGRIATAVPDRRLQRTSKRRSMAPPPTIGIGDFLAATQPASEQYPRVGRVVALDPLQGDDAVEPLVACDVTSPHAPQSWKRDNARGLATDAAAALKVTVGRVAGLAKRDLHEGVPRAHPGWRGREFSPPALAEAEALVHLWRTSSSSSRPRIRAVKWLRARAALRGNSAATLQQPSIKKMAWCHADRDIFKF